MDLELETALSNLLQLGIAYVIALPVAWNREKGERRNAGLRTFPLVAIAACGYMLIGMQVLDNTDSYSRVFTGIVTGIGFIGGGAILKNKSDVRGTATAASLWVTGAVGIAVASKRYEIAIVLALIAFLTMHLLPVVKDEITGDDE